MPYGTLSITIAAVLWLLFCYRFWRLVGARHPGQRHLIAAAAGLGAALIYIAGQMMLQAFAAVGKALALKDQATDKEVALIQALATRPKASDKAIAEIHPFLSHLTAVKLTWIINHQEKQQRLMGL